MAEADEGALEEKFYTSNIMAPLHDVREEPGMSLTDGGFGLLNSVMVDGGDRFGVSALAFDSREELLWMGNSGGHLTSYYGPALEKYTSFQAHARNDIRQILTIDAGVLALSKTNLKCNSRQGLGVFNYTSPNLVDMQCMHLYSPAVGTPSTSLLLGGYQTTLLMLDLYELKEVRRTVSAEPNCSIARATEKFLFTGDTNGKIAMRNWETLETIQILDAHGGPLSDFDICGTKLVTCGFSARPMGGFNCDRFLMIYDLRMLRAVAPITVSFDPFFLRFLPAFSDSRLLVASQAGNFQVIEIGASTVSPFLYHVDTQGTPLFSIDVSPSKQCVAFGDGAGFVHLFSDRAAPVFNECSRPTEFANPITPLPPMSFCDQVTPLSLIPMPLELSCGRLLSDWPPNLAKRRYRTPKPIDQDVLQNMTMTKFIGHAQWPANKRFPNVVPYDLKTDAVDAVSRSRSPQVGGKGGKLRQGSDPLTAAADDGTSMVPSAYRKMIIKYGRDEPDYRTYNQTTYSALEPFSPNSYINPLFQVLFHMEPLRNVVQSHICRREFCLTCEMSFLFHMLHATGDRQTCSASNFLRAFRTMPEAAALGLVLNERDNGAESASAHQKSTNLGNLIQGVNLFLLRQLHAELADNKQAATDAGSNRDGSPKSAISESEEESKLQATEKSSDESVIENLFATSIYYSTRCKCGRETSRDDKSMVLTLTQSASVGDGKNSWHTTPANFASALEKSFSLEHMTQTWCDACSKFQSSLQARRTKILPEVLVVNCPVDAEKAKMPASVQLKAVTSATPAATEKPCRFGLNCVRGDCFYSHPERSPSPLSSFSAIDRQSKVSPTTPATKQIIPSRLNLRLDENGVVKVKEEAETDDDSGVAYELYAVVELIREANDQHLVACVCTEAGWVLFNDYCVTSVASKEAATFDLCWKMPCLLFYTKRGYRELYADSAIHCPIDERVFMAPGESVAVMRRLSSLNFVPLEPDEIPKRGDHVGLDAEFVTLNEEEAELHSDGTKLTIKPSQMSVARVTVIRGSGSLDGVPFIDDYISTQEEVVNYLTKFSGIKPGDLDPSLTSKHLTTLKSTYVKLRFLIDNGVIFIGHGLVNDFKVLNLAVPFDQMIDTVQLFRLPNRRMISLRFLAWYFLGVEIQSITHDSVEDARTAMKLYKKYQELIKGNGVTNFNRVMNEVYEKGRSLQWRIPGE